MLKEAVATMGRHKISFIIVAEGRKPLGVLSERDIVRLACGHIDPAEVQIKEVMTSPVITVTEDANIFQVYDLLNSKRIRHMVVVDSVGLIAGLATLTNILGGLSIEFFVELKQVATIMSQNISTLNMDDTVQQALELMTEKRISCIIITRNQHPVGIITERDITRLYGSDMLESAPVATVMASPVRTVDSSTFIPQANAIMRDEKLRHLVIVNADGSLAGLISQTDIARRIEEHYVDFLRTLIKEQEKKLLYEDERFSILFEHNPNAVVSYDGNGTIVNTNRSGILLSGYSQKEMSGKSLESFIHPEDIGRVRDTFHKATEHKAGLVEFRILQKSGRVVHVFNTFLPIYVDNRLHRIYSIMHDISATKEARQQVRIAEERARLLSQAVEQAGDSIIITDREGTIEFVNRAFTHITGFTPEDVIGKMPSILKSGEQDRTFYEQMWSTITKGEQWQSRLVDRRKNGERYPAELSISPVHNEEGEITHFIGIKRDLTERETLERQFHQAQKMEAIGTLVGGIAHDFNNILAGITGSLYLAKRRASEMPEVLGRMNTIETLSYRAANMIQQLLTFARKDQVCIKQMALTPFINEILRLLRSSVPENITFQYHICSGPLQIKGDGTQLHQVLMNLLSNARDAVEGMDDPRITVRLEAFHGDDHFAEKHPCSTGRGFAHLSVEDNGCGIAEDQVEHLFEPFYTTKEVGRGTGLGLAMVFGAIKSHDGSIDVESTPGDGSTFHIYIPLEEPQELADLPQQVKKVSGGEGETILIADDEPHVREILSEILETLGYRVLQAENGLEAIQLFEAHQKEISLALLDVVMPHCGGMKLARKIREIAPSLPILFLTGYDQEHALGSEEMEQSEILTKPVQFDALSHTIRQLLD